MNSTLQKLFAASNVVAAATWFSFSTNSVVAQNTELSTSGKSLPKRVKDLEDVVTPPGAVIAYAGISVPVGWEICDGREVSRTETKYAALFTAIGTNHGIGDGTTTFHIPDYRGRFLRGADDPDGDGPLPPAGRDLNAVARQAMAKMGNAGNYVGSIQEDELKSHNHSFGPFPSWGLANSSGSLQQGRITIWDREPHAGPTGRGDIQIGMTGGAETRPKNAFVNYIIRL